MSAGCTASEKINEIGTYQKQQLEKLPTPMAVEMQVVSEITGMTMKSSNEKTKTNKQKTRLFCFSTSIYRKKKKCKKPGLTLG